MATMSKGRVDQQEAFEVNRRNWNNKVGVHAKSDFYDMEGFKAGKNSLHKFELEALGDVSGRSLLHLQCHFGQDTLSWARLGANCTGVDISDKAIELARELTTDLGLDARFVCCNVLDTSRHIDDEFDLVFSSYGVIGWLPDLGPWAKMIAQRLKPGGIFYLVEFHPICWMYDYTSSPPRMIYSYDRQEAIYEEYSGTYADPEHEDLVSKEYGWNHGLSEVIAPLLAEGLELVQFSELHQSPYDIFPGLVADEEGYYRMPDAMYPLLFELKFRKPISDPNL